MTPLKLKPKMEAEQRRTLLAEMRRSRGQMVEAVGVGSRWSTVFAPRNSPDLWRPNEVEHDVLRLWRREVLRLRLSSWATWQAEAVVDLFYYGTTVADLAVVRAADGMLLTSGTSIVWSVREYAHLTLRPAIARRLEEL